MVPRILTTVLTLKHYAIPCNCLYYTQLGGVSPLGSNTETQRKREAVQTPPPLTVPPKMQRVIHVSESHPNAASLPANGGGLPASSTAMISKATPATSNHGNTSRVSTPSQVTSSLSHPTPPPPRLVQQQQPTVFTAAQSTAAAPPYRKPPPPTYQESTEKRASSISEPGGLGVSSNVVSRPASSSTPGM